MAAAVVVQQVVDYPVAAVDHYTFLPALAYSEVVVDFDYLMTAAAVMHFPVDAAELIVHQTVVVVLPECVQFVQHLLLLVPHYHHVLDHHYQMKQMHLRMDLV